MGRAKLARALLACLQDNYPERVAKIILCSSPWWLSLFLAIIRPILSRRTLDKLVVVSPRPKAGAGGPHEKAGKGKGGEPAGPGLEFPELLAIVSPGSLEDTFGGTLAEPDFGVPPSSAALGSALSAVAVPHTPSVT